MENQIVIQAKSIYKSFYDPVTIPILKDINFSVNKGEFCSIIGKSGCGKSTLLYILSTMDTAYEGELLIDRESMSGKEEQFLASGELSIEQIENRKLLRRVMQSQGFKNIETEWWHFNACSRNEAKQKYLILKTE